MASTQYKSLSQKTHEIEDEEDIQSKIKISHWPPNPPPIAWTSKISTTIALAMLAAFMSTLAVIGFLCFLWMAPRSGETNNVWLRIVLHGWILRAVTISALILRTATSTLATAATSMIACIFLERHDVTLSSAALLSVIRVMNNGPQSLLPPLRRTSLRALPWAGVTVGLVCVTLTLQFSSTALVADFGDGVLSIPSQENSTLVGFSLQNVDLTYERSFNAQPYWNAHIQNFPTFAEHQVQAAEVVVRDAVRDTGPTIRAFVPFSNPLRRTTMKQFMGTATALDSRVVCVRPQNHAGLTVGLLNSTGWIMNGTLIPEIAPPGLVLPNFPSVTQDLAIMSFNVSINQTHSKVKTLEWTQQLHFSHEAGEWNVVQKMIYQGSALVSSLDPRYPRIATNNCSDCFLTNPKNYVYTLTYFDGNDSVPLMTGRSYVLLKATTNPNMNAELINATNENGANGAFFSPDQDLNRLIITPKKEWLTFTIPRVPGFDVAVTLCYDSFVSINAEVNITSDTVVIEPPMTAYNISTNTFDTRKMRDQLGTVDLPERSSATRGVMTLHTTPDELREQVNPWYNASTTSNLTNVAFPNQNFVALDMYSRQASGTVLCAGCGIAWPQSGRVDYLYPGNFQRQIFQDVINGTSDSSLAIQAYYTVLGRMAYYDSLSLFDIVDHPVISWFETTQFPQSSRGLVAVLICLCVHLALVTFITFVFLSKTKVSYIGDNAWQSLAQAHSSDLEDILQHTAIMKDNAVAKQLAAAGLKDETLSLSKLEAPDDSQKIGLRRSTYSSVSTA